MSTGSPPTSASREDATFDYVIVGSGAGGAPLAARLAERGHRVLVLEAGPDHGAEPLGSPAREVSEVPALHAPSTEHPDLSWQFFVDHYADPGKLAPGELDPKRRRSDGRLFYPRATGVGGCTIHNAMITVAGPTSDWDELAWYLNDPSWSADVMRGYFRQLERCEYHPPRGRSRTLWRRFWSTVWWLAGRDDDPTVGRHGFDGWLHTSIADPTLAMGDGQLLRMLKAAVITSLKSGMEAPSRFIGRVLRGEAEEDLDPNHFRRQSERPEGVALIPCAIHGPKTDDPLVRGRRSSPAQRLRDVAADHPNLVIATDCLATKVILQAQRDGRLRATGVEYLHGRHLYRASPLASPQPGVDVGAPLKVHAKCEVILCGGTFNTPQLLMLSGIGPRAALEGLGLPCHVDSPGVGQNLQDRYEVTVVSRMPEKFSVLNGATFKLPDATPPGGAADPYLEEWRKTGRGLYASNGAVLGILKRSRPDLAKPDLFIFGIPLKFKGYQVGYSKVDPGEFDLFTWAILKSHTHNRGGTVKLASAHPLDPPVINFAYFGSANPPVAQDDPDLDAVLAGVKFVRRIAGNAGLSPDAEAHPGRGFATDPQVKEWIRRDAWGHHACGSCRMGRRTDPSAVTDSRFQVLGPPDPSDWRGTRRPVLGLRVVDASIFPSIPGYFIVSNLYMAAEKAADVIHADRADAIGGKPSTGGGRP